MAFSQISMYMSDFLGWLEWGGKVGDRRRRPVHLCLKNGVVRRERESSVVAEKVIIRILEGLGWSNEVSVSNVGEKRSFGKAGGRWSSR
jgi:hypothetical protein